MNYRYPPISAKVATMEVAEIFMSLLSGVCSAFKKPFFGFYVNGVTLADGMGGAFGCVIATPMVYYPQ